MTATNGATNGATKASEKVPITSATDPEAVSSLIKELSALGEGFSADSSEDLRLDLALKARTLWKALETPRETMIRHCWAQVCFCLCLLL